ncbi:MAG: exonuclease domain-containing protein, partial [Miltoncostaeaceae bacterium]
MTTYAQLSLSLPRPQPGAEREDSLGDRLLRLIERRGRPLEVGHVAAQLLRLRGCPPRLQRQLVAEIVESDPRLAWHGSDTVGFAPAGWRDAELAEAQFCVVDLETTGGAPGRAKITEIGAVRVRGLRIVERFSTLVNPERPMPDVVRELTGIDDEMVADAPLIDTALPEFCEFAGDDVLVAHNAPFDLRFLNYERRRLSGRYFRQPWLDTLVLARRLLGRRVDRHDLGTLARWADTSIRPNHRALPDAEATAELLPRFVDMLAERGVQTLERAVALGGPPGPRNAYKLALAEDLPSDPGVYLMRDRRGEVLYIGKATNLRRRVRSYFGPGPKHGRLVARALDRLEAVDHEVCGSELEALLRESELLRTLRPPCNKRGVGAPGRYVKLTLGEAYPRVYSTSRHRPGDGLYAGPVRSDRTLRLGLDALHEIFPLRRCHPGCEPGEPATQGCGGRCSGVDPREYAHVVEEARSLLAGEPTGLDALRRRLVEGFAAGRLVGDQGRDQVAAVLALVGALGRVRRACRGDAVVAERVGDSDSATLFFVARGRVVHRADVRRRGWRRAARRGLAAMRVPAAESSEPLPAEALDEALIVDARLTAVRDDPTALRLPDDHDEALRA